MIRDQLSWPDAPGQWATGAWCSEHMAEPDAGKLTLRGLARRGSETSRHIQGGQLFRSPKQNYHQGGPSQLKLFPQETLQNFQFKAVSDSGITII
ncbi:hypothetical protein A6R68_20615 [Neotoma lepida]|uniref:Uncharacterized protein n=1 Tax=Neotoma lepida TaxID=56216 RepID=A0A1A6HSL5_NEOLE|nr:hypothetical protein A6R68_20615 [Neotoma lepida]